MSVSTVMTWDIISMMVEIIMVWNLRKGLIIWHEDYKLQKALPTFM